MADPRFFDNRGPFTLAQVCGKAGASLPPGVDTTTKISDLATLGGAGPSHLAFFAGDNSLADAFAQSQAGFCFVQGTKARPPPHGMVTIPCASALHAFAAATDLFYPQASLAVWSQDAAIHPTAEIGARVMLAPGVVVGPGVVIGEGTSIGPGCVIGRGVLIGRDCEIGSNADISHAYIGDAVTIFQGAQIGQSGFGFAPGPAGHTKIPQIGRVIIQDRVEIGACTAVDRGGLGDTVIGEGSKIDNLVQIAHNVHIGRHCLIAAQVGIAGSTVIGDFVVIGGQAGIGEHAQIGSHARIAAIAAVVPRARLAGDADYGGYPAKPLRHWIRELHAVAALGRDHKRGRHD